MARAATATDTVQTRPPTPAIAAHEQCGNCRFWLAPAATAPEYNRGVCRENPQNVPKLVKEWCGRWQRKDSRHAT